MAVNNKSRRRNNKYWQECWVKRTLCTVDRDVASSSITLLHIDGGKVETVTYFILLGFKMTVDSDCSHKIKKHLLLGRKAITNLDSVLESRDITLMTKVHIVKSSGFSSSHVWVWELDHKEGWMLKNWAFKQWYWRRLLRVPWTASRSNQ